MGVSNQKQVEFYQDAMSRQFKVIESYLGSAITQGPTKRARLPEASNPQFRPGKPKPYYFRGGRLAKKDEYKGIPELKNVACSTLEEARAVVRSFGIDPE
ncbi:hypothetical protein WJX73_009285 [Symbiochloris irregularis]|uniref:Uncharacterized protein n=1 Tax=Symbiochloris irregularis TaxID=706552 RepID=A0AAW1PJJ7_9CHLO